MGFVRLWRGAHEVLRVQKGCVFVGFHMVCRITEGWFKLYRFLQVAPSGTPPIPRRPAKHMAPSCVEKQNSVRAQRADHLRLRHCPETINLNPEPCRIEGFRACVGLRLRD